MRNGVNFSLHRCSLPAVVDLTGQLKPKEKEALERGLRIVNFSKKSKHEYLSLTAKLIEAEVSIDRKGCHVKIPPCKGSVRSFGPFVGIDSQIVVTPALPAHTVHLPALLDDPQLRRTKQLRKVGIFKRSDKGAALLFIPIPMYRKMGHKHLETPNYVVIAEEVDIVADGLKAMQELVDLVNSKGTPAQRKLLCDLDLEARRERHIYFLPKPHKAPDVDGLLKVRPIVDCRETALAAADKVAALFCAPLNKALWTTVSSTIDLLEAINELDTSGYDAVFFTADVADLYTNVPIDEGIKAVETLLNEEAIGTTDQRQLIVEILKITLNFNVFTFAEKKYRQIHGIPMGSNSAPIVADAFLFVLERDLVKRLNGVHLFKRFRDDITAICSSVDQAKDLGEQYGSLHPRIKIEVEISREHANVLDVRLGKFEDGSLRLGVYFKPMNSLPLLHRRSNHPDSTLRAAIQSRILNFLRICNNTEDLLSAIFSLANSADRYGYAEADILSIAHDMIKKCATQQWPYRQVRSARQDFTRDWRPIKETTFVRGLEPLYKAIKQRKVRLVTKFGKNIVQQISRTKDC